MKQYEVYIKKKKSLESASSNSMFQIDLKSAGGGIISWGSECRLIHLATGKYLALNREPWNASDPSKLSLKLVRDPLDPYAMFIIHPVDKVGFKGLTAC